MSIKFDNSSAISAMNPVSIEKNSYISNDNSKISFKINYGDPSRSEACFVRLITTKNGQAASKSHVNTVFPHSK